MIKRREGRGAEIVIIYLPTPPPTPSSTEEGREPILIFL